LGWGKVGAVVNTVMNLRFHIMLEFYLINELLAIPKGLSSME
jgi:phage-related holin